MLIRVSEEPNTKIRSFSQDRVETVKKRYGQMSERRFEDFSVIGLCITSHLAALNKTDSESLLVIYLIPLLFL